jgi:hypothetical protein
MDGFDPQTTFGYETSTALPLLRAGVPVDGIEQSQHMDNRMREKPDDDTVRVVIGDMSCVGTGRRYRLVYLRPDGRALCHHARNRRNVRSSLSRRR